MGSDPQLLLWSRVKVGQSSMARLYNRVAL